MPGTVLGASGTVVNRTKSWAHGAFIVMGTERQEIINQNNNKSCQVTITRQRLSSRNKLRLNKEAKKCEVREWGAPWAISHRVVRKRNLWGGNTWAETRRKHIWKNCFQGRASSHKCKYPGTEVSLASWKESKGANLAQSEQGEGRGGGVEFREMQTTTECSVFPMFR